MDLDAPWGLSVKAEPVEEVNTSPVQLPAEEAKPAEKASSSKRDPKDWSALPEPSTPSPVLDEIIALHNELADLKPRISDQIQHGLAVVKKIVISTHSARKVRPFDEQFALRALHFWMRIAQHELATGQPNVVASRIELALPIIQKHLVDFTYETDYLRQVSASHSGIWTIMVVPRMHRLLRLFKRAILDLSRSLFPTRNHTLSSKSPDHPSAIKRYHFDSLVKKAYTYGLRPLLSSEAETRARLLLDLEPFLKAFDILIRSSAAESSNHKRALSQTDDRAFLHASFGPSLSSRPAEALCLQDLPTDDIFEQAEATRITRRDIRGLTSEVLGKWLRGVDESRAYRTALRRTLQQAHQAISNKDITLCADTEVVLFFIITVRAWLGSGSGDFMYIFSALLARNFERDPTLANRLKLVYGLAIFSRLTQKLASMHGYAERCRRAIQQAIDLFVPVYDADPKRHLSMRAALLALRASVNGKTYETLTWQVYKPPEHEIVEQIELAVYIGHRALLADPTNLSLHYSLARVCEIFHSYPGTMYSRPEPVQDEDVWVPVVVIQSVGTEAAECKTTDLLADPHAGLEILRDLRAAKPRIFLLALLDALKRRRANPAWKLGEVISLQCEIVECFEKLGAGEGQYFEKDCRAARFDLARMQTQEGRTGRARSSMARAIPTTSEEWTALLGLPPPAPVVPQQSEPIPDEDHAFTDSDSGSEEDYAPIVMFGQAGSEIDVQSETDSNFNSDDDSDSEHEGIQHDECPEHGWYDHLDEFAGGPTSMEAYLAMRAQVRLQEGNYADAERDYRRALPGPARYEWPVEAKTVPLKLKFGLSMCRWMLGHDLKTVKAVFSSCVNGIREAHKVSLASRPVPIEFKGDESFVTNEVTFPLILGALGAVQCSLGEMDEAVKHGEQAVSLARYSRTNSADEKKANYVLGEFDDAEWPRVRDRMAAHAIRHALILGRVLVYHAATLLEAGRLEDAEAAAVEAGKLVSYKGPGKCHDHHLDSTAQLLLARILRAAGKEGEELADYYYTASWSFARGGFLDRLGRPAEYASASS
ncbi:hypothetical protein V8E36_009748 [Tilletia maclaganii]